MESGETTKWNFPTTYGKTQGFGTGNLEAFKKEPVAYFAREICQNSLDAHASDSPEPVRVDFKTFSIHRNQLPDFSDIYDEVVQCRDYVKEMGREEYIEDAQEICDGFGNDDNPYITCLRVSDFNTTGAYGVKEYRPKMPFFELIRGSGSSYKSDTSAGSKGMGKYASFVVSNTKTVFYSTRAHNPNTDETELGHIGISIFCARPVDDDNLFTMGDGFCAIDERNNPAHSELHLDPDFHRGDTDFGTDVFIIGFNDDDSWRRDIIQKVLESFMVAIVYGALVVNVGDTLIDKNTVGEIVDGYRKSGYANKEVAIIISQYDLLMSEGDSIHKKTVTINGCDVDLFIKTYSAEDGWRWATKQCVAVRYPYMKITKLNTYAMADFSAMCIIGDNELNEKLRKIENAQHVAWEKNRLRKKPDQYKEVNTILRALNKSINDFIEEVLRTNSGDSTDFEGAGDYLPDSEIEETQESDESIKSESADDKPVVSAPTRRKARSYSNNSSRDGNNAEAAGLGDLDEDGVLGSEDIREKNDEPNPNPDPIPHDDSPEHRYGEGEKPYMRHLVSDKIRFRCIKPANNPGAYDIVFTATEDSDKCEVNVFAIGDSNDKDRVEIISAKSNNMDCAVKDGSIVDMSLRKGETYKISCIINRDEVFASKVEIYAC